MFRLSFLKIWLPLAITITFLSGLIYLVVQQDIRIGANDPQIQIAEDIASQLANGQNPQYFMPLTKTDISKSLANYVMFFNQDGGLISSSASLEGKSPTVPQGVFITTKQNHETRFTWQPQAGVRSAVVAIYYKGAKPGFVLVGRSLREIEIRENQQEMIVLMGWTVTMLMSLSSVFIINKI